MILVLLLISAFHWFKQSAILKHARFFKVVVTKYRGFFQAIHILFIKKL